MKNYKIKADCIQSTWIIDPCYPITIRPLVIAMLSEDLIAWVHKKIPDLQKELNKGRTFAFICEHFNEKELDLGPAQGRGDDIESLYIIAVSRQKGLEVYLYVGSRAYIAQSQERFAEHWEKQLATMKDAILLRETKLGKLGH
jgi:hypothetical protein